MNNEAMKYRDKLIIDFELLDVFLIRRFYGWDIE